MEVLGCDLTHKNHHVTPCFSVLGDPFLEVSVGFDGTLVFSRMGKMGHVGLVSKIISGLLYRLGQHFFLISSQTEDW